MTLLIRTSHSYLGWRWAPMSRATTNENSSPVLLSSPRFTWQRIVILEPFFYLDTNFLKYILLHLSEISWVILEPAQVGYESE